MKHSLSVCAQVFLRLCSDNDIRSCAITTSLKNEKIVFSFCESLCRELNAMGETAVLFRAGEAVFGANDQLMFVFAPHPEQSVASFQACTKCEGVVFIEQYGVTKHKALDELVAFLREQEVPLLGTINLME